MIKLKHSRQRDAIKDALCRRYDHPTADEIYREIRETDPHISLGTVYRNLSLLSEIGEIRKVIAGDGREHYDGTLEPHDHFRCRLCGRISDIFRADTPPLSIPGFAGRIEQQSVIYIGVCPDCLKASEDTPT